MLIQYKFKVHGRMKPDFVFPLTFGKRTYEFELKNTFIDFVVVRFPLKEEHYPFTTPKPSEGVAMAVNANEPPDIFGLKQEMRQVEGLLSIFGCSSIDTQSPEVTWLPESDEEREKLQMYSMSCQRAPLEDHEIPPLSFDLIARPVLAAARTQSELPALSFYRKGRNDMKEDRYIDAIYDFIFCLEYEFGKGKTKNYALEKAFCESDVLVDYIDATRRDDLVLVGLRKPDIDLFNEKYGDKEPSQIIKQIIMLRGFLHHQTSTRPDIWAPDEHDRFRVDANFLQTLVYRVVWQQYEKYVYDQEVIENYRDCYVRGRVAR